MTRTIAAVFVVATLACGGQPARTKHVSEFVIGGAVAKLAGCRAIGLDTEADSLHHYTEKVCLIQLT